MPNESPTLNLVQPLLPTFELSLPIAGGGHTTFDFVPPEHLAELQVNMRATSAGNKYSIKVIDATWVRIEQLLKDLYFTQGHYEVPENSDPAYVGPPAPTQIAARVRWGWVQGDGQRMMSPWHKLLIQDWRRRIEEMAQVLVIEATDTGTGQSNSHSRVKSYKGQPVSILRDIAAKFRYTVLASDLDQVTAPDEYGRESDKRYTCPKRTLMGFFRDSVLPDCAYKGNRGNVSYTFFPFDKVYDVHTCKEQFIWGSPTDRGEFIQIHHPDDTSTSEIIRRYEFMAKQDGSRMGGLVRVFQPEFSGKTLLSYGSGLVVTHGVNLGTKKSVRSAQGKKDQERYESPVEYQGEDIISQNQTEATIKANTAQRQHSERGMAYAATLDVLGDPCIIPFQKYHLTVLNPQGDPDPTTGVYYIREVNHTITPGDFNTSLVGIRYIPSEPTQVGDFNPNPNPDTVIV